MEVYRVIQEMAGILQKNVFREYLKSSGNYKHETAWQTRLRNYIDAGGEYFEKL